MVPSPHLLGCSLSESQHTSTESFAVLTARHATFRMSCSTVDAGRDASLLTRRVHGSPMDALGIPLSVLRLPLFDNATCFYGQFEAPSPRHTNDCYDGSWKGGSKKNARPSSPPLEVRVSPTQPGRERFRRFGPRQVNIPGGGVGAGHARDEPACTQATARWGCPLWRFPCGPIRCDCGLPGQPQDKNIACRRIFFGGLVSWLPWTPPQRSPRRTARDRRHVGRPRKGVILSRLVARRPYWCGRGRYLPYRSLLIGFPAAATAAKVCPSCGANR